MVQLFADFKELHGSSPSDIIDAAKDPQSSGQALVSLSQDLVDDAKKTHQNTEGDIQAITTAPNHGAKACLQLGNIGQVAAACLTKFGTAAQTFDKGVDKLNHKIATSGLRDPSQPDARSGSTETIQQNVKNSLEPDYRALVKTLDKDAGDTATLLKHPNDVETVRALIDGGFIPLSAASQWPGLTLTDEDKKKYYKSVLGRMSTQQQIDWVNANKDHLPPEAAPAINATAQAYFAGLVGDDFKDPDNIDGDTVTLLEFFENEHPFAQSLYDNVTPEQVADAIKHVNDDVYPNGYQSSHADDKKEAFYRDFLTAAGATFATYTKGTGKYAPPSDLTDRWYDAVTSDKDGQGAALTLLLRAGGQKTSYDTHFISDLTDRVYDWEKKQDGPVWGPRDDDITVNPFLTNDDHYRFATDGLANLLGSMEHSPDAARTFFTDGSGQIDEHKLDYLIGDTDVEKGDLRTFSSDAHSDEGEGLGAALEAAAVSNSDDPATRTWCADFASDVFNRVGGQSGTGDGYNPGIGSVHVNLPDDTRHAWPGIADNLGNIAASYSSDVYDIIDGNPQDGDGHLHVSSAIFDKVLGEIGRGDDKSGIETLSAAEMIEGNHRLNQAISDWQEDHPGQPLTMDTLAKSGLGLALQGRGSTNGEVLGHILNKSVLVDIDDDKLASTRAAYVSKAVDIAGGFIPGADTVLGEGKSELVKSAFDISKDQGLDLLKDKVAEAPDATSDEYRNESRATTERGLEYNTLNQLIDHGYLGDQHPGDHRAGVDHSPAIPSSLLVDGPNGTKVVNPDLYDADGVDKIGKTGQYSDAQIRQMRHDWNTWMNSEERNIAEGVTSQAQDGFDREVNKGP